MISTKPITLLPVIGILSQMGLTLAIATHYPKLKNFWVLSPSASPQSEPFRQAVNKAINAAKLTQSAKSSEEWNRVATSWQEAIALMKAVPVSNSKYSVAQNKVSEYQRNLQYALSKVSNKLSISPVSSNVWTFGSTREDVINIQGTPTGVARYEPLCQETIYYENSTVQIQNGIVTEYDNSDKNLRVSVNTPATHQQQGSNNFWSLGSTKEEVFRIQGTPAQLTQTDLAGEEVFYYGSSTVTVKNGLVIGYKNLDSNLRVSVNSLVATQPKNTEAFWSLGSNRVDVFRIQGIPTQFVQYDSLCKQVAYYGSSTVEFKNSIVEGYYNVSNNLKVR